MLRRWLTIFGLVLLGVESAQDRRPRIDVEHYRIDAEIHPRTQSLSAQAQVRFVPLEDITAAVFELNNGLAISRVSMEAGGKEEEVPASRAQELDVRLNFPATLPKGKPVTVTFAYDGRLAGLENSPVEGVNFGWIGPDRAFLLYPARWFPVSGYTADRFSMELNITMPAGLDAVASGIETSKPTADGKVVDSFRYDRPSFPGSIAVVSTKPDRVTSEGATTTLYFRGPEKEQANAYGDDAGKIVSFFSSQFDLPPSANLTIVETEEHAPNGYAAPGIVFLSPRGIGKKVNARLLAQEIAHQWWRVLVSPASRRHLWLDNGFANYSRMLYTEHAVGRAAFEAEVNEAGIEALTHDDIRIIESDTLPDYSPELLAVASNKGALVLHMLRSVVGDEAFFAAMKQFAQKFAWNSATTADFEKIVSDVSKQNLQYFFLEWVESTGASEFKLEYTIFRLGQGKGFRVMGKVSQDKDTFRMPVEMLIETEGEPERKTIEVQGTASEFSVDTFGKPKKVILDPDHKVLRLDDNIRVAVAIKKGEQLAEQGFYNEALQAYQRALDVNHNSSLAHYRIAEVFFLQSNYQSAANEFRESLNGDQEPKWTEVWSHINLGKVFDITGQRERAVNEYQQAVRTKDNTQNALDEANKYLQSPYQRPRRSDER
ncbi:MAG: tetratricopeptide repeat protein [Acidobacteria bacterium]|nr:tetratricopeptide repeat protein [Acidobacteriota bacterium]